MPNALFPFAANIYIPKRFKGSHYMLEAWVSLVSVDGNYLSGSVLLKTDC